jgi:large conductance mechanosensitive channel
MPPLGLLLGKVDFSNLFVTLSGQSFPTLAAAKEAGVATLNYGVFINTIIDFLIVAFAIFLLIRQVNRFKRPAPAVAATVKECQFCASEIPLKATRCPHCTSQLGALTQHT